jgi:hypothetical protein
MKLYPIGLLPALLACVTAMAQGSPSGITYQAIARNADGNELANSALNVTFTIHQGAVDGTIAYEETQATVSNMFGLFTLVIGQGIPTGNGNVSSLYDIDWASFAHFLRIQVDLPDDTTAMLLGVSQLLTVPYAFHATTAEFYNEGDGDPSNETLSSVELTGNTLSITESGNVFTVDLSSVGGTDNDDDPANESLTTLALTGNTLSVTESGNVFSVDLSSLAAPDADADPENESLTALELSGNILSVSESGNVFTVDLSSLGGGGSDDDDDELITDIELENTTLTITEAGEEHDVSLASLEDGWDTASSVTYTNNLVGIKTDNPQSTLHIAGSVSYAVTSVSTPGTIVLSDAHHVVLCNVDAGNITVQLPAAATCTGRVYIIKRFASSIPNYSNDVWITPVPGETIDLQSTYELASIFEQFVSVISDGSDWWIINKYTN